MNYNFFQQQLHKLFYVFICLSIALLSTAAMADVNENQFKKSDEKLFEQAVGFSSQKQWSKAEPIYRDLLKRNKQWPELGNNLAVLLLNTNRIDEAKDLLEQAVSSSPSYRITQQNRSQLYNYLAKQAYDKALGLESDIVLPELEFIDSIYQSVQVVEKEVEKIVVKEVIVEKIKAPEVQPKLQPVLENDAGKRIKEQLNDWSHAWSQGDFEFYIQSYSNDFLPSDNRKNYQEWKNIRRARLKFTKGVSVEIDQIRVFVEPEGEYALVEFMQNYRSDSYSDQVLKQMYMRNQHNNWLILSERTIKKY